MKVTAIMYSYHGYYYQRNEANLMTRTTKTEKEKKKILETTQTTYQTPISNNSADYVKNAYEVSFKPHELIYNLQEV